MSAVKKSRKRYKKQGKECKLVSTLPQAELAYKGPHAGTSHQMHGKLKNYVNFICDSLIATNSTVDTSNIRAQENAYETRPDLSPTHDRTIVRLSNEKNVETC